jgi:biotin carboxyl carrier protein
MIKQYTITVNGTAYDVTVEEKTGNAAPVAAPSAPAVSAAPATPVNKPETKAGGIEVVTGAAGKVFNIPTSVGQSVKKGDPIIIIEAMKMEIGVTAPEDGTIASIDATVGDMVEAGDVLATLN